MAEEVTYQGFRACVRELKSFDGFHREVQEEIAIATKNIAASKISGSTKGTHRFQFGYYDQNRLVWISIISIKLSTRSADASDQQQIFQTESQLMNKRFEHKRKFS